LDELVKIAFRIAVLFVALAVPLDGQSIRSAQCTSAQRGQLERAVKGICAAVAQSTGQCRKILTGYRAIESFERQCTRGLIVQCREAGCGEYLRRTFAYRSDNGTIVIGLAGFIGGPGCGGRDEPSEGPSHTLAHEMAHAAGLFHDVDAEKVAYACRGR
jgi:hypothetical protein